MSKNIYDNYTFIPSAGKVIIEEFHNVIVHIDITVLNQHDIYMITNVTTGDIIYNPQLELLGSFTPTGDSYILTLDYDTSSMNNTDELQIILNLTQEFYEIANIFDRTVTYHTDSKIPQPGSSIFVDLHSKVSTEGHIMDNDKILTLDSTKNIDGVMQVFRASTDNIHDMLISMKSVSVSDSYLSLFDCEYVTDQDAQNDWVSSSVDLAIGSSSTIVNEGLYSLSVGIGKKTVGLTATHTYSTSQDWSDYIDFIFDYYADKDGIGYEMRLIIEDTSLNQMYIDFYSTNTSVWVTNTFQFSTFINYLTIDFQNIKKIIFETRAVLSTYNSYFDNIKLSGSVSTSTLTDFELYSFGSTPPTAATMSLSGTSTLLTLLTNDDGTTFTTEAVPSLKHPQLVHFHYGSHNISNKLTVGNYYGILIKKPIDGVVETYGMTNMQHYQSGGVYSLSGGALTHITDTSSAFIVLSHVPGIIKEISIDIDGDPDFSYAYIMLMDSSYGLNQLLCEIEFSSIIKNKTLKYDHSLPQTVLINENNNALFYFVNGVTSTSKNIQIEVVYNYKHFDIYG